MITLIKDDQEIGFAQTIIWHKTSVIRPTKHDRWYMIEDPINSELKEVYLGSATDILDAFMASSSRIIVWPNHEHLSSSEIVDILKKKDVFYYIKDRYIIIYENAWEPFCWSDRDEWNGPCSFDYRNITTPIHMIE